MNFKELIQTKEYDFLREDTHLGDNIIMLTLGGSYAYGTNNEDSDVDIRGIATNSPSEILTARDFGQVVETDTDTVIYSFNKMMMLLASCNPNTIEILGNRPEDYLIVTPAGQMLLDNKDIFLSKKAAYTFGGYAHQQLVRLCNKSASLLEQSELEKHILKSIEHARMTFAEKYAPLDEFSYLNLYVDTSDKEKYDSEIFFDGSFSHYSLRDFADMWNEMHSVIKSYEKVGKRNEKAIEHGKLGKHQMHLVRLYYMVFDILEKREIHTYREKEHEMLMDIRNGKYLDDNRQPTQEFYEMLDELENRLDYDARHTDLPDEPDMEKIYELMATVNYEVCTRGRNK